MKSFLGEVVVIGEHVGESFVVHHLHGMAIRQAVLFVRTGGVEIKGMQKACPGLGNDRNILIVQNGASKGDGTGAYCRIGRTVEGQKLGQYLIGGVQMVRVERGIKRQHTCVPLISGAQESDPVERIGEEPPHSVRFGVP